MRGYAWRVAGLHGSACSSTFTDVCLCALRNLDAASGRASGVSFYQSPVLAGGTTARLAHANILCIFHFMWGRRRITDSPHDHVHDA